MPLNILIDLVLFIIELLRMSLFLAIPGVIIAFIGLLVRKKLMQRFQRLDWIKSTFLSTYLIITLLIILMYAVPIYSAYNNPEVDVSGPAEQVVQYTPLETIAAQAITLLKLLIASFVITLLLQPLILLASYVQSTVQEKWHSPRYANLFIAIFIAALVIVLLDLFVFPSMGFELVTALFYLIYFW